MHRALERIERRVEALCQPGELVPAADLQALGGIRVGCERLRPASEPRHGGERRTSDKCSEQDRRGDAGEADHDQHEAQPAERMVDLRERSRHLNRAAVGVGRGKQTKVDPADGRLREVPALAGACDGAGALVDG